jgi:hypothetical protein
MTIEKLLEIYHANGGKGRVIKEITNKREAKAFRKFLLMEIYRHVEDIQRGIGDVEAVTKEWGLPPEKLDIADLNAFFKVR